MALLRHLRLLMLLPATLLGACSATNVLNRLADRSTFLRVEGIAFRDGPRGKLDLYQPLDADGKPRANVPVVLFFYGGSWNSGDRADYLFVGEALASRGLMVVIADYRLYPEVRYPDFLNDGAAAADWVARETPRYGGDPARLYIMGHSAGAYNAAMLALDPRWLAPFHRSPGMFAGLIGLAGAYNFFPMKDPAAQPVFFHPHYPANSLPIQFVSAHAPRTLLIAPAVDPVVRVTTNTAQFAAKLQEDGVSTTVHYYPRLNHVLTIGVLAWPLRGYVPVLDDIVAFIADASR